jgi:hypothetical protein
VCAPAFATHPRRIADFTFARKYPIERDQRQLSDRGECGNVGIGLSLVGRLGGGA